MEQTKSIFASTTFWSAVVGMAGFAYPKIATLNPEALAYHASNLMEFAGFVGTIIGRYTATKQVTLSGQPATVAK